MMTLEPSALLRLQAEYALLLLQFNNDTIGIYIFSQFHNFTQIFNILDLNLICFCFVFVLNYRVFINYRVFPEDFKIFWTLAFLCFPSVSVSV